MKVAGCFIPGLIAALTRHADADRVELLLRPDPKDPRYEVMHVEAVMRDGTTAERRVRERRDSR